jgi:hypothetical protein
MFKTKSNIEQPIQHRTDAANKPAGSECEVMFETTEYDENLGDPADLLALLAVLHAAVRDVHPEIEAGVIRGASMRNVHDAALRVIGAAHNPRDQDATLFEFVCEAIDRLAEKLTISGGGTQNAVQGIGAEAGAITGPPRKPPAWCPLVTDREYDPNVDEPNDILDLMAVLDAAVREALPQFLAGTAREAILARVHDAALRVIGAARNPSSAEEQADRGLGYLKKLSEHVFEAMDRLVDSRFPEYRL